VATLDPARDAHVDLGTKGFPALDRPIPLGSVAGQGWTLADLPPPVLVLRERGIAHNLALMASYCREHRVELAPHGKTTMAPQLWRRQLDAGAWGITAATVAQARVMAAAGVGRILIANEVTDPGSIRWVAARLHDAETEIVVNVDSARGVRLLADELAGVPRPLPVLVELGHRGGRTGSRSVEEAMTVAGLVSAEPELKLAGATGYEGTICQDRTEGCLQEIRRFLEDLAALTVRLRTEDLVETDETWVSAGGSAFFDLVVDRLRTGEVADRVILRSGCYLTHDAGHYERLSPFANEELPRRFRSAIEAWGGVLSRPEPALAIMGVGRRDVPYDLELPTPFELRPHDGGALERPARVLPRGSGPPGGTRRPRRVRDLPPVHGLRQVARHRGPR
jgi:D-serine deaminase-like pyridoxal phosphate-dependent protein